MRNSHKSRNMHRILSFMSRHGRYPYGISQNELERRFDKEIISELLYYDYLEETSNNTLRITVHGREALKVHVLTVVNTLTAILALAVAVLALFF